MQIKSMLLVFIGGGIGSVSRLLADRWVREAHSSVFPWSTLMVNMLGCLLIGVFMQLIERLGLPSAWKWLLITGFCGGFTTFSTFSMEIVGLLSVQKIAIALLYLSLSVILGVLMAVLGVFFVKQF